jgi:hypothetical protein
MLPSNVGSSHDLSGAGDRLSDAAVQGFSRALIAQPDASTNISTIGTDGAAEAGVGLHGPPAVAGRTTFSD